MPHLTIKALENYLANLPADQKYAYVETGRYKPYTEQTVLAAKRRGYKVEKRLQGVYYIYPKQDKQEAPKTFTVYAFKTSQGDVKIYKDRQCIDFICVFPEHLSNRPTKRNKYVTIDCYKYLLEWVN